MSWGFVGTMLSIQDGSLHATNPRICTHNGPNHLITTVAISIRYSSFDYGVLTSRSNLGAEMVKKIWNRNKQSTESTQDGQRPLYSQVPIEGNGHFDHTTCGHVSNQCHTGKRAR